MPKQFYRILDNLSPSEAKLATLPRKPESLYNLVFNQFGQLKKRKGYAKYNTTTLDADHKIVGLHRFYKSSSATKEFLAVCNKSLYKLAATTPYGGTVIDSTLTADKQTFFANYYNTCYLVNGTNGLYKYDGTNFYKVGMTVPTAPTYNSRVNGSLTAGTYHFKVTYVDSDGYESNASNASSAMTAQADPNDGLKINISVSSDAKVAKRYIYRTTVGGSIYYYDGVVANNTATTYSSTASDATISMNSVLHDDHDAPPSTPHLICKRRSRLLLANGDAFYISQIADVEYFPSAWLIYTKDRQKIYGLMEQQESLAVFTEDSIERLIGQDEDNFEFVNAYSTEGCIAMRSLVNCENLLLYLGCDGIYYFDGVTSKIINIPLSEYVNDNINSTYAYLSCATYFDNKYLLSYPKGTSTVPNETVYIDFRTGDTGIFNYGFSCFCKWDRGTDGNQLYGGSNTEGRVYKIGEALTDDGSSITAYDDVCPLDFGMPDREKTYYSIYVKVISTTGTALRIYYQVESLSELKDEAYVDVTMTADTEQWYRARLPGGVRGRSIALRPYVSDSYDCALCGYMIEYDVAETDP